jgi:hypothetical protein
MYKLFGTIAHAVYDEQRNRPKFNYRQLNAAADIARSRMLAAWSILQAMRAGQRTPYGCAARVAPNLGARRACIRLMRTVAEHRDIHRPACIDAPPRLVDGLAADALAALGTVLAITGDTTESAAVRHGILQARGMAHAALIREITK